MKYLLLITNLISMALLVITTQIVAPQSAERPSHIHKTLLVDRNFTDEELMLIMSAATEWTEATHHVAEIDVIQLPNDNEMLSFDSIIVTNASPDSPDILIQEAVTAHSTLGLYTRRQGLDVVEIVSSRIPKEQYRTVVLHELGHAFGLEHAPGLDGIDTLMCPYIEFGANHITPTDLENFCKLYKCSKN